MTVSILCYKVLSFNSILFTMFVYIDNIQRTVQLMPEKDISLFQILGRWFVTSVRDWYWKENQEHQESVNASFIDACCSVMHNASNYLLENCHGCIWRQDVVSLIYKHLLVVGVWITATEVFFIEFKCLMEKCCGVLENWA